MPEEDPLQALAALQLVFKAEGVVLVCSLEKVEHLCRCLHDREGRVLSVVYEDWDAAWVVLASLRACGHNERTIGIESEEPFLLLLIGHDVD